MNGKLVRFAVTYRRDRRISNLLFPVRAEEARAQLTHLDQPSAEETLVHDHCVGHEGGVAELDVRVALGVARELVAQNRHAVDGAARLEVLLDLLGRRAVVHLRGSGALAGEQRDRERARGGASKLENCNAVLRAA